MSGSKIESFPSEVISKLQYYVYRLIDPRNGETFYIGKGRGNRVFTHAAGNSANNELSDKLARIREIQLAGFEVSHVIHRHGLSEEAAFEVEAALIDAYPGITNIVSGHGSNDYGAAHAAEIIKKYAAEAAEFHHKALIISINRTALETSVYEATRYAWRISVNKACEAEVVLASVRGVIVDAFVVKNWMPANSENFPGREPVEGRYGFIGENAPPQLKAMYLGKRLPDTLRKKGSSNPIKYTW